MTAVEAAREPVVITIDDGLPGGSPGCRSTARWSGRT